MRGRVADLPDYRIGGAGTSVTLLSERAVRRGVPLHWPTSDELAVGSTFKFPTTYDVSLFVHLREAQGFIFEGEEELIGV